MEQEHEEKPPSSPQGSPDKGLYESCQRGWRQLFIGVLNCFTIVGVALRRAFGWRQTRFEEYIDDVGDFDSYSTISGATTDSAFTITALEDSYVNFEDNLDDFGTNNPKPQSMFCDVAYKSNGPKYATIATETPYASNKLKGHTRPKVVYDCTTSEKEDTTKIKKGKVANVTNQDISISDQENYFHEITMGPTKENERIGLEDEAKETGPTVHENEIQKITFPVPTDCSKFINEQSTKTPNTKVIIVTPKKTDPNRRILNAKRSAQRNVSKIPIRQSPTSAARSSPKSTSITYNSLTNIVPNDQLFLQKDNKNQNKDLQLQDKIDYNYKDDEPQADHTAATSEPPEENPIHDSKSSHEYQRSSAENVTQGFKPNIYPTKNHKECADEDALKPQNNDHKDKSQLIKTIQTVDPHINDTNLPVNNSSRTCCSRSSQNCVASTFPNYTHSQDGQPSDSQLRPYRKDNPNPEDYACTQGKQTVQYPIRKESNAPEGDDNCKEGNIQQENKNHVEGNTCSILDESNIEFNVLPQEDHAYVLCNTSQEAPTHVVDNTQEKEEEEEEEEEEGEEKEEDEEEEINIFDLTDVSLNNDYIATLKAMIDETFDFEFKKIFRYLHKHHICALFGMSNMTGKLKEIIDNYSLKDDEPIPDDKCCPLEAILDVFKSKFCSINNTHQMFIVTWNPHLDTESVDFELKVSSVDASGEFVNSNLDNAVYSNDRSTDHNLSDGSYLTASLISPNSVILEWYTNEGADDDTDDNLEDVNVDATHDLHATDKPDADNTEHKQQHIDTIDEDKELMYKQSAPNIQNTHSDAFLSHHSSNEFRQDIVLIDGIPFLNEKPCFSSEDMKPASSRLSKSMVKQKIYIFQKIVHATLYSLSFKFVGERGIEVTVDEHTHDLTQVIRDSHQRIAEYVKIQDMLAKSSKQSSSLLPHSERDWVAVILKGERTNFTINSSERIRAYRKLITHRYNLGIQQEFGKMVFRLAVEPTLTRNQEPKTTHNEVNEHHVKEDELSSFPNQPVELDLPKSKPQRQLPVMSFTPAPFEESKFQATTREFQEVKALQEREAKIMQQMEKRLTDRRPKMFADKATDIADDKLLRSCVLPKSRKQNPKGRKDWFIAKNEKCIQVDLTTKSTTQTKRKGDGDVVYPIQNENFDIGTYRMDDSVSVQKAKKGQRPEEKQKIKTRGIPNKHLNKESDESFSETVQCDPTGEEDAETVFGKPNYDDNSTQERNKQLYLEADKSNLDSRHMEAIPCKVLHSRKLSNEFPLSKSKSKARNHKRNNTGPDNKTKINAETFFNFSDNRSKHK